MFLKHSAGRSNAQKNSCGAVIVAAGSGRRMELDRDRKTAGVNKVFLQAADKPVLAHTLVAFEQCRVIDKIVVVTRECDIALCGRLAQEFGISKLSSIVCGGDTRSKSVLAGLKQLKGVCSFAAIHDGARCLVESTEIEKVVAAAYEYGAAALGIPCSDSLKRVGENGMISENVNREGVYRVQTPQVFDTVQITEAHEKAQLDGFEATDDCAVAEHSGIDVFMVRGSAHNIKLTTRDDMELIEAVLKIRNA